MKKLILVVTIAVLGILACKKKDETPTPEKKYEYKRTPGEVSKIEGDVFVDTGGTVFTVKGKGFDPMKKSDYHLYLWNGGCNLSQISDIQGAISRLGTSEVIKMTDSTIQFRVKDENLFSTRKDKNGNLPCVYVDSVQLYFAVSSRDSSNKSNIVINYDKLKYRRVKNKLVFNILKDTLLWHKNVDKRDTVITVNDVVAGGGFGDPIQVYLNNKLLTTSNTSSHCFLIFNHDQPKAGDGLFLFNSDFYNDNKNLGLTDGFYTITMKESKTGMPLLERHGKKGVYIKFVN